MRIKGLNAPIPKGSNFGYQAGGWGKPPVDIKGKPIYGDVFGSELNQDGNRGFGDDDEVFNSHELSLGEGILQEGMYVTGLYRPTLGEEYLDG